MRTVAVLQARATSTRLPGKVLLPGPDGKPLLDTLLYRVNKAKMLDEIVVAIPYPFLSTTAEAFFLQVTQGAERHHARVVTGEEDDVLLRVYEAARVAEATHVVRLTADNILTDPEIIDLCLEKLLYARLDYVATGSTYPEGLDTEAMTIQSLWLADKLAVLPSEREHVTPWLRNHPRLQKKYLQLTDAWGHIRVTIDVEEDYFVLCEVLQRLGRDCTTQEIIDLYCRQAGLWKGNRHVLRNEKYLAQVAAEKKEAENGSASATP